MREAEQIKAFRDTWELGIHSYLTYLRDRLLAARELLTASGSCFVQIGDENVHLVRALMDEVFGAENFISQITFAKTTGQETLQLANVTDFLIWYGVDKDQTKVRQLLRPKIVGGAGAKEYKRVELGDGRFALPRPLNWAETLPSLRCEAIHAGDITSDGGVAEDIELPDGRVLGGKAGVHWKTTRDGIVQLWHAGRVMPSGAGPGFISGTSTTSRSSGRLTSGLTFGARAIEPTSFKRPRRSSNGVSCFQPIYDKPFEDPKRVRVAGPFTVES